jgi:hypothetical protein
MMIGALGTMMIVLLGTREDRACRSDARATRVESPLNLSRVLVFRRRVDVKVAAALPPLCLPVQAVAIGSGASKRVVQSQIAA